MLVASALSREVAGEGPRVGGGDARMRLELKKVTEVKL